MSLFLKSIIRNLDVIFHLLLCVILYILYRLLVPLCNFRIDEIHYLYPCLQSLKGILLFVFVHFGFYIGIRQGHRHEYLNRCYTVANDDIVDDLSLRLKIERRIFEAIADSHGVDFLANAHAERAQFVPANSTYVTDTFLPPREGILRRRKYVHIKEPVLDPPPKAPPQRKTGTAPGAVKGLLPSPTPPTSDNIDSVHKDAETTKKPPPGSEPVPPPALPTNLSPK
uniref:Bestrophin homolog n=1 Tax=Panagrellus redivivus TaxID=6233 RepID=A0A7E4V5M1_PANRE